MNLHHLGLRAGTAPGHSPWREETSTQPNPLPPALMWWLFSTSPQILSGDVGQVPSLKVCEWIRWEPGSEIPCQLIFLFSRFSPASWDRMGRWKVTFGNRFSQGTGRAGGGVCTVLSCDLSAIFLLLPHLNSSLPAIPHLFVALFWEFCCPFPFWWTVCTAGLGYGRQQSWPLLCRLTGLLFVFGFILQITWEQVVLAFLAMNALWAAVLWGRVIGAHTALEFDVGKMFGFEANG